MRTDSQLLVYFTCMCVNVCDGNFVLKTEM